jgi:hypothetical protein
LPQSPRHEPGDHLEVESVLEVVERLVGAIGRIVEGGHAIFDGVTGIGGRELHEAALLAALGHVDADLAARGLGEDLGQHLPVLEVAGEQDLPRQLLDAPFTPPQVIP